MTVPPNGITPGVIRDIMPAYHLSFDLLEGTFAALPPPPRDAPSSWRQARITRLTEEIVAFLPADAAQARLAAEILIARALADTLATRAYAPEVTVEQMCRLSRTSAELLRTAALLLRTLERCQQKPVPFYGTVVEDAVDIAALDAVWCQGIKPSRSPDTCFDGEAAPDEMPAPGAAAPREGLEVEPAAGLPNTAGFAANVEAFRVVAPGSPSGEALGRPRFARSPAGATGPGPTSESDPGLASGSDPGSAGAAAAGSAPGSALGSTPGSALGLASGSACGPALGSARGSVVTRLDQGPGWTLNVVRPRTDDGTAPAV